MEKTNSSIELCCSICPCCFLPISNSNILYQQKGCPHRYCQQCTYKETSSDGKCILCPRRIADRTEDFAVNSFGYQSVDFNVLMYEMTRLKEVQLPMDIEMGDTHKKAQNKDLPFVRLEDVEDELSDERLPFEQKTLDLFYGYFLNLNSFDEAVFRCVVCKENLLDPLRANTAVILPKCLHTLCLECTHTIRNRRPNQQLVVECPTCRAWNDMFNLSQNPEAYTNQHLTLVREAQKNYRKQQVDLAQQYDVLNREFLILLGCFVHKEQPCAYIHRRDHRRACVQCVEGLSPNKLSEQFFAVSTFCVLLNQQCTILHAHMKDLREKILKQIKQNDEILDAIRSMMALPRDFTTQAASLLQIDLSEYVVALGSKLKASCVKMLHQVRRVQAPQLRALLLLIKVRKQLRDYIKQVTTISPTLFETPRFDQLEVFSYFDKYRDLVTESERQDHCFKATLRGEKQRIGNVTNNQIKVEEVQWMLTFSYIATRHKNRQAPYVNTAHPCAGDLEETRFLLLGKNDDCSHLTTIMRKLRSRVLQQISKSKTEASSLYLQYLKEELWVCRGVDGFRDPFHHDCNLKIHGGVHRGASPTGRLICVYDRQGGNNEPRLRLERDVEHVPPCYVCLGMWVDSVTVNLDCLPTRLTQEPKFQEEELFIFGSSLHRVTKLTLIISPNTPAHALDTFIKSIYHLLYKLAYFELQVEGDYQMNHNLEAYILLLLPLLKNLTIVIRMANKPLHVLSSLKLVKKLLEFGRHDLKTFRVKLVDPVIQQDPGIIIPLLDQNRMGSEYQARHFILYQAPSQSIEIEITSTQIRELEILYFYRFILRGLKSLPLNGIQLSHRTASGTTFHNNLRDQILETNYFLQTSPSPLSSPLSSLGKETQPINNLPLGDQVGTDEPSSSSTNIGKHESEVLEPDSQDEEEVGVGEQNYPPGKLPGEEIHKYRVIQDVSHERILQKQKRGT